MAHVTPNRGWSTPDEYADPYWAAFTAFVDEIDADVQALFDSGHVIYQGAWNANTNTPSLASGVGTKGHYYVVSVSGSTDLDGETDWVAGDWAIFNGTAWQKVDNTQVGTTLDGAYGNFGSDPATVVVDGSEGQGDLKFDLTGAYSFDIDLGNTTGSIDGFRVYDGESTEYWRLLRKNDNAIDLEAALQNANHSLSGNFDVAASGFVSLDAGAPSNFTVDGADLTLSTTTSGDVNVSSANDIDAQAVNEASLHSFYQVNVYSASSSDALTGVYSVSGGTGVSALTTLHADQGGSSNPSDSATVQVYSRILSGSAKAYLWLGSQGGTFDTHETYLYGDDLVRVTSNSGAVDINASTSVTIDANAFTIDADNDSSITITGQKTLTIDVTGANKVDDTIFVKTTTDGGIHFESAANLLVYAANNIRIGSTPVGGSLGNISIGENNPSDNGQTVGIYSGNASAVMTLESNSGVWMNTFGVSGFWGRFTDGNAVFETIDSAGGGDVEITARGSGKYLMLRGEDRVEMHVGLGGSPMATFGSTGLTMSLGTNINEFSTDGTLSGDSDNALPTEKAVKTYVDNAVLAEDFWDRSSGVISPQTSGDSLDVTIPSGTSSIVANFDQQNTSTIANGVEITSSVIQPSLTALTGSALKVTHNGAGAAPVIEVQNNGGGPSMVLTGSSPNLGLATIDANVSQWAIAQTTVGGTRQATFQSTALALTGSTSADNLRVLVQAQRDIATAGGTEVDLVAKIDHTSASGDSKIDLRSENNGTGKSDTYLRADISNAANNSNANLYIQAATTGGGTANIDMDADNAITIDAGGGVSIDAAASSNFSTTAGNLNFIASAGTVAINAGGGRMDIDANDELEITAGNGMDIDVTGTYDMLSSGTFTIAGTGSSTITTDSGDLQLNATSGGAVKLHSYTSGIAARLGDNAGSQKFFVRDSDDANVATIDSNGVATFTGITLDAGNISTDTTTGMQIATSTSQKIAFYGATPIPQPTTYTQTYSASTSTHAARTASALTDSIGGSVGTTLAAIPDPADSPATADALRDDLVANVLPKIRDALSSLADQVNKGRADAIDSAAVLNQLIDDVQAFGLAG